MPKLAAVRLFAAVVLLSALTSTIFAAGFQSPSAASPAGATTTSYVVTTTADGTGLGNCSAAGSCTLRQAIDQYNADTSGTDAITFSVSDPATFNISTGGPLVIINTSGVSLTITGGGTADTFIDGGGSVEVLSVEGTAPVTLDGLTIQHGGGTVYGAGIWLSSEETLTLDHVDVTDNQGVKTNPDQAAPAGAGIFNNGGTLTLDNSTVSDNAVTGTDPTGTVGGSGAGIWSNGTLTLDNSTVSDNTVNGSVSGGGGGAIYNGDGGTLTIDANTVSGNTAPNGGGISSEGSLTSQDSTISNNNATAFGGGGIENYGTASLQGTTVSGNTAVYGGGIYTDSGTLTLDSSTVSENTASTHGGGIDEEGGNTSLTATSVVSNTPDNIYPPATAPHITSISDNTSPITGGAQFGLYGHGFTGATSVQVGSVSIPVGTDPDDATVEDDQDISVTAPAASPARAGAVEVTVTTPLGTSTLNPGDVITYVAAPALENVSPSSVGAGPTSSGVQLGLSGYGFTGATSVQIGGDTIPVGTATGDATVIDDQAMSVTAPAGTVGTVAVSVTTPEGTTPVASGAHLTYDSVPQVDYLYYSPPGGGMSTNTGSLGGGETVNISGSGFTGATAVYFGTVPATNVTVSYDDYLSATAPAATNAGPVDVTVVGPGGTSAVNWHDVWFYEPSGTISGGTGTSSAPSVSSLSQQSGPSAGGETIYIFGTNLTGTTAVDFGTTAADSFTVVDSGEVDVVVPAGLAVGTVPVTVTTGTGPSAVPSSLAPGAVFTTTVTPVVDYIDDIGDGTVEVWGSGLSGVTTVDFGTSAGTNLNVYGDDIVTVTPPSGTRVVDVTVTSSGSVSSAITPVDSWAYLTAPVVSPSGWPPIFTPAGGGLSVGGGDFPASSSVDFTEAGTTTPVTPTSQGSVYLSLNAPSDSPGPATVTVTGGSQASPVTPYGVVYYGPAGVSDAAPVVIGTSGDTLFANQAPNLDEFNLYGSGFTSATSVQIGDVSIPVGTADSDATVENDDLLYVPVPGNTPLGEDHVTVTNSYGISTPTTDDLVNVLAGTETVAPPPPSTATSSNSAVSTSPTGTAAATIGPLTATGTGEGGVTVSEYGNGDPETSAPAGTTSEYLDVEVSSGNTFNPLTITVCGLAAGQELQWFGGSGWEAMTPQSFDATTGCATATITATSSPALDELTGTVIAAVTPSTPPPPPPAPTPPPTVTPTPTVTSVTPTSGSPAGGTSVTITGTNFTGATAVHFGTTSATTFTVGSDTSITATSPAGTAGTVNVTVTTPSATSATSAGDQFTYVTVPGAPTKVSAKAGNASALLTWTAPSSDGGVAINGYVIKPSRGRAVTVGDVTRDTVTGLTNGTAYSFTVSAVNSVGTGPSSAASNSVTPAKATSETALKLSAKKVTYGDEQAEHLSVTVSPQHSGPTVTGTVTIKASATTLCVIKLKSAKGSCSLSARRLKAGTYHLVATYGGSANYKGSTSVKETLTVAK